MSLFVEIVGNFTLNCLYLFATAPNNKSALANCEFLLEDYAKLINVLEEDLNKSEKWSDMLNEHTQRDIDLNSQCTEEFENSNENHNYSDSMNDINKLNTLNSQIHPLNTNSVKNTHDMMKTSKANTKFMEMEFVSNVSDNDDLYNKGFFNVDFISSKHKIMIEDLLDINKNYKLNNKVVLNSECQDRIDINPDIIKLLKSKYISPNIPKIFSTYNEAKILYYFPFILMKMVEIFSQYNPQIKFKDTNSSLYYTHPIQEQISPTIVSDLSLNTLSNRPNIVSTNKLSVECIHKFNFTSQSTCLSLLPNLSILSSKSNTNSEDPESDYYIFSAPLIMSTMTLLDECLKDAFFSIPNCSNSLACQHTLMQDQINKIEFKKDIAIQTDVCDAIIKDMSHANMKKELWNETFQFSSGTMGVLLTKRDLLQNLMYTNESTQEDLDSLHNRYNIIPDSNDMSTQEYTQSPILNNNNLDQCIKLKNHNWNFYSAITDVDKDESRAISRKTNKICVRGKYKRPWIQNRNHSDCLNYMSPQPMINSNHITRKKQSKDEMACEIISKDSSTLDRIAQILTSCKNQWASKDRELNIDAKSKNDDEEEEEEEEEKESINSQHEKEEEINMNGLHERNESHLCNMIIHHDIQKKKKYKGYLSDDGSQNTSQLILTKDSPDSFASSCLNEIDHWSNDDINNAGNRYWTDNEEDIFIQVYNGSLKESLKWSEIVQELSRRGVQRSRQQCSDKLKYLLSTQFAWKNEQGEIIVTVKPSHRPRSNQMIRRHIDVDT